VVAVEQTKGLVSRWIRRRGAQWKAGFEDDFFGRIALRFVKTGGGAFFLVFVLVRGKCRDAVIADRFTGAEVAVGCCSQSAPADAAGILRI